MSEGILLYFFVLFVVDDACVEDCWILLYYDVIVSSCLMASVILPQIKALHLYDCLRANKSTSAWGVEARVPFLDKEFLNVAMSIDPEWKMVQHLLAFALHCFPIFKLRAVQIYHARIVATNL